MARRAHPRDDGLFPSEAAIARRLSQSPEEWAGKSVVLEREGLPPIDPTMGGRFWPAVQAFFGKRYGLSHVAAQQPDGPENLNALRPQCTRPKASGTQGRP